MAIAVIAISLSGNSGAGESVTVLPTAKAAPEKCPTGSKPAGEGCIDAKPVSIEKCPGVQRALRFYTKRWQHWTSLRTGAGISSSLHGGVDPTNACPRYLLKIRAAKARAAHKAWNHFFWFHYAWSQWLPSNWRALAVCETGLNFEHSNSSFTSAFGISWAVYNSDAAYMGAPPWHVRHTPRDQYMAALGHLRRFGDGWTCPGP